MEYDDFQYYGMQNNGVKGWSPNTLDFSNKGSSITSASQSGLLGNTTYGGSATGAPNSGVLGSGTSLLGGTKADGKGGMNQTMGVGGLALGAFDAWNSWNQGNKMYDLQEDAFNFSKDKFWNNMAMQRDAYNRDINRKNFMHSKVQDMYQNPNMTEAEKQTMNATGFDTYMNDGNAIRDLNGNESNVIDIPGQYTPGQQSAFNQPTQPISNPADTIATNNSRTIARTAGMNPGYANPADAAPQSVAKPRTMSQSAKSYKDPKTKVVNKQQR